MLLTEIALVKLCNVKSMANYEILLFLAQKWSCIKIDH